MKNIHLLENVERDQSNKTRIQILDKNKLQAEFDRLDKNQARNRRFLIWQRNNCLRQNARLCGDSINENKSSGYSSHLKDGEIKGKPQMNKSNRMDLQIIRNKFSMIHPRVPTNEDKQELHWKCHQMLITDKMTNNGLKSNKRNLKTQNKHKVFNENRIKYRIEGEADTTEFYDSLTLFQRIIRGRAYQTMMIMAKIRYQPILHSDEGPVTVGTTKIKEITSADVLEYSRQKFISRFFDALSNEANHIKNTENKNNMLIRQGNLSRIANEMVERKIRQIEITGRIEQDEILKQVLKIHEDVSVLFCEKILEEAVLQSAKEESLKATMKSSKKRFYSIESDKNIERELMSTFIIPEVQRVIFGESQNRN